MNRAAWAEAWRWQREKAAVPWLNRVVLAGVFLALFLAAASAEHSWTIGLLVWLPFGFLVIVGIVADVREAASRLKCTQRAVRNHSTSTDEVDFWAGP